MINPATAKTVVFNHRFTRLAETNRSCVRLDIDGQTATFAGDILRNRP
ncbi:hypothetical protein [Pseudomonas indica]|nr:hypothetical protein [Pseudomonas indica]